MTQPQESVPLPAWTEFLAAHSGGGVLDGRVADVMPFGAFVEIADGIQGFLPKSAWSAQPTPGSTIPVKIDRIDLENRRMSLVQA